MEAQRVLGELELARKILLNAASRKDYEQSLRAPTAAVSAPTASAPAALPPQAQAPTAAPPQAAQFKLPQCRRCRFKPCPCRMSPCKPCQCRQCPFKPCLFKPCPCRLHHDRRYAHASHARPSRSGARRADGKHPDRGGHIPMATVAPPTNVNPFGGAVQANSSSATKVNYRRKKRNQNALAFQIGGVMLCAALGLGIYASWDTIKPKPVYKVDKHVVAQVPADLSLSPT